jgi:spore germination protein
MWKPSSIFICALLIVDSFFVSYAVGLNSRHVLVEESSSRTAAPIVTTTNKVAPTPSVSVTPASKSFTDLSSTEGRLQSSLTKAAQAGILDPTQDNKFRPNDPVTRAEFARWMVRVRQVPLADGSSPTYSDVPASSPYFGEIEGATKAMMVQGYTVKDKPQKEFKPDQFITRQEFAVMYGTFSGKRGRAEKLSRSDIEKYLRYNVSQSNFGTLTYKDVGDVDDWARKWVAVAQQAGVLLQCFDTDPYVGDKDKTYLRPQEKMTRAEAVNILVKLYGIHSRDAVQEKS